MSDLFLILDLDNTGFFECLDYNNLEKHKRFSLLERNNFPQEENQKVCLIVINSRTRFMRLEVPPVSKAKLKKIVPHLIEDITLGDLKANHIAHSSRSDDGYLLVSITPKKNIEECLSLMHSTNIYPEFIIPIESLISVKSGEGFLVSYGEISFVNFNNKWRWNSDQVTLMSLIKDGITEYGISKMSFYHEGKMTVDVRDQSIKIKNLLDFIDLNKLKLSFELNLLEGDFKPKVRWNKLLKKWKVVIASILIIFLLGLLTDSYTGYKNQSIADNLNKLSIASYKTMYPNEPFSKNITGQIRRKLKSISNKDKESFMDAFLISSKVLSNNPNASIFSINFEKENYLFLLEIECSEFEDLEDIKLQFLKQGFKVQSGSSRRSGNSIIGELSIKKQ